MKKLTALAGRGQTQSKASCSTHFTELLPVSIALVGSKEISVVSRKNLHAALGVGRVFASWFNAREAHYGFVEDRHQLQARISAANYFKPMCNALELTRAEIGKSTEVHHYTTESNMLSRFVLGEMTAKQWAKVNEISGDPRDNMSAKQLEHLSYLELSNITLIELGWDYPSARLSSCDFRSAGFLSV